LKIKRSGIKTVFIEFKFFLNRTIKDKISKKVKRAENWIAFNKWRLMLTCKPRTSHATFAYRFLEEIIMAFFAVWHRVLMAAIIDTREYLFLGTLQSIQV